MERGDDWPDFRATRVEDGIKLVVKGATQDQLAHGIAVARKALQDRGVGLGLAGACHIALMSWQLDPTVPEPDEQVRMAALAVAVAKQLAVKAAGGSLERGDYLAVVDDSMVNVVPTIHAYRDKHG